MARVRPRDHPDRVDQVIDRLDAEEREAAAVELERQKREAAAAIAEAQRLRQARREAEELKNQADW
jgi:hypothetical protein